MPETGATAVIYRSGMTSGQPPTVLVSLDGVAPRFITPERMPHLTGLARSGSACFNARTVDPPWTRPAHASMLRGVDPNTHGLIDNSMAPLETESPTVLEVARKAGLTTASVNNWLQMDSLIEPRASTYRFFIDAGYDPSEDDVMVDLVDSLWTRTVPDLTFVYLCRPDLVGHEHGWGSDPYLDALHEVDARFGRLLEIVGSDANIVVTTDHGGLGNDHASTSDDVMTTFVVTRSARLPAGSYWASALMLDIAPTVAELCGIQPDPRWEGASLIGHERPVLDHIMDLLGQTDSHSYGESLTMLQHALQSAAKISVEGGDDDLVLAALLHDLGHLLGEAGDHGVPEHAELGAAWLQHWLPAPVVEPIRLHVRAKRHLVGSDPAYAQKLSAASVITLDQQGGPFSPSDSEEFLAHPHAERAMQLRRCDDDGKVAGLHVGALEDHRDRLGKALRAGPLDATMMRDACRCSECRDPRSDQHLLTTADVVGWTVLGSRRLADELHVDLVRDTETHTAVIPHRPNVEPFQPLDPKVPGLTPRAADNTHAIALDVVTTGIALVSGIPAEDGEVLRFAETLGYVRETNYGRLFEVRTEPQPTNLAYSPVALPLHTDNPYRDPRPTVQILHCLVPAAEGGATRLADGFAAAEQLRADDPGSFDILTSTTVCFRYHDHASDLQASRSVIELSADGAVRSVAVNNRSLDTPGTARFHDALGAFVERLEALAFELTLTSGQAIVFDNRRLLHARTGFDPRSGRHLQGCYIDIDSLWSTVRSLPR